jgi:hypothetical protein
MDAAEHDYIGVGFGSPLAQIQGIADKVSHILDLTKLVVVDKKNSIPSFPEDRYFLYQC